MGSRNNPAGTVAAAQNAPLYGTVIMNLVEESPAAIIAAIGGDTSYGTALGFLTGAPTFNVARESVNTAENIMGLSTRIKGTELLQNEEATIEVEFASLSIDNLKYALPGTVKSDWTPAVSASITAGTGNSSVTVRALTGGTGGNSLLYAQTAPSGTGAPYATVTVTGTAPAYTITVASKTDATANHVIDAINSHATAKTLVQAGRPAGTTGAGVPATLAATALAGGAAGTRIGYTLTSPGTWGLSDYIRTVHVVWESAASRVAMIARAKNAISMDDFSFQANDDGTMGGASMTLTATSDEADFSATTGNYVGGWAISKLDDVAA